MATEKKSKKGLIIVIFSLLLVGGGVGYYFWKKSQDEKEEKEKPDADANANSGGGNTGGGNSGGGGGGGGGNNPPTYTFPFKTEAEGNTFRAWVIAKDKAFADSIQLSATGKLNGFVQKAWDKYGVDYLKPATTPPKTNKGIRVNIADLLATDVKQGIGAYLYADANYYPIYNLSNAKASNTKKDEYMGIVTAITKSGTTMYKIQFIQGTGIQYYVNYYIQTPYFYFKI